MSFKGLIAATASVALMAGSTAAVAQTAPEVAPATERVEEGSELRGGWIIPLIALIAIILGLCIATDQCGFDDDHPPTSP